MEIKGEKEQEKISILLEDLASLETYARDLFTFLPLPVCLVSSIGIILEANPAFGKISGHEAEEIIGKPIDSIFEKREIQELSSETFEKGFVGAKEINILKRDKQKVPVRASTVVRKTEKGEIIGYFIGFFDLSDVKKKENELQDAQTALLNMLDDTAKGREREQEEHTKTVAIISNFADGLLVFDKDNRLSLVNPKVEDFFDIEAKQVVGKSIKELAKIPILKPLIEIFGEEIRKVFRKELPMKENLVLEVTTAALTRAKERLGTLVVVHDISREKLIEQMKTEFVSLSAHQLRTPLSAIKWTLKMLLDGDLGPLTEEQRDFIEKTYKSNERLINLVNDLLNITRIEEGRYLYGPVFADLQTITQFVINSYREAIEKKNIKFEFRKSKKKLLKIPMDVEKIKLVISNLLDNAIKYTSPGGKVIMAISREEGELEFKIKDTGVGIPEKQQNRVFSKFFRGANAVKLDTEGTGLGLFVAKNIIEAHGGKIWFESKEKMGTTFYFTIPIREEFE